MVFIMRIFSWCGCWTFKSWKRCVRRPNSNVNTRVKTCLHTHTPAFSFITDKNTHFWVDSSSCCSALIRHATLSLRKCPGIFFLPIFFLKLVFQLLFPLDFSTFPLRFCTTYCGIKVKLVLRQNSRFGSLFKKNP